MGLEPRRSGRASRAARGSDPERVILVRDERGRGADVTDSGWRGSQDAWWSDALRDPWRDPASPSAVVVRPTTAGGGVPRAGPGQPPPPRRGGAPVVLILLGAAGAGRGPPRPPRPPLSPPGGRGGD